MRTMTRRLAATTRFGEGASEGRRTITASRKTCVIWNCVHHARKHATRREPACNEPLEPARER